jgi:DNA gyrase subunit A
MGRSTSGVRGMKFRPGDELLAMVVVHALPEAATDADGDPAVDDEGRRHLFVVFENGNAKRTEIAEYRVQGRAGYGIKVAADAEKLGNLVGAVMVRDGDEVMVVMEKGKVVRSRVDDVGVRGRTTQGVRFARPDAGDSIIAITRNDETVVEAAIEQAATDDPTGAAADGAGRADAGADGVPSDLDDSGDPASGPPTGGEA